MRRITTTVRNRSGRTSRYGEWPQATEDEWQRERRALSLLSRQRDRIKDWRKLSGAAKGRRSTKFDKGAGDRSDQMPNGGDCHSKRKLMLRQGVISNANK